MIGDGRDMTVRTPARNHHVIGEGGFSGQIYGNNLLGFVIIKTSENQIKQFTMGSDFSSALLAGFRGRYMRGQGKFSIFIATFSLSRTSSVNRSIRCSALVASWVASSNLRLVHSISVSIFPIDPESQPRQERHIWLRYCF